jgi:RNase P/RNase MRP subunit p29
VVWLRDGDRITGRILSETARTVRLQTPFGRLAIPKSRIERLVRADGREEVLHPPEVAPSPSPTPAPVGRLVLAISGKTFWQAWDRKDAPADPSLRLEVRLDEEPVAAWADARLDPEEMPGAVVNAFSFAPADVTATAAPHVELVPPEVRPGRVVLHLGLPGALDTTRRLRLAYQVDEGTVASPAWRDVAGAARSVGFRADTPTVVEVLQDRGRMEFSGFPRHRMRNVETFRIELTAP